jgi:predicted house-cleaning noncanonical NTP pyrophosphatase (MazG superfamily)
MVMYQKNRRTKMANNVNNHITVTGNESAQLEFTRLVNAINKIDKEGGAAVAEVLFNESDPTYAWSIDTMGAKWVIVEDAMGEEYLTLTSAWYQCDGVQDKLHELLKKFDEDVEVHMIYEDEMPLFTGYRVLWRDNEIDQMEEDGLEEELCEIAEKANEGAWDDAWMERMEEIRGVVYENAEEELKELREEKQNEQTV